MTGAAQGLGRALWRAFEAAGWAVVAVDVEGGDCVAADVGTAHGTRVAVQTAIDRHGRLDALVLNAGVQHVAPLRELDEHHWTRLHDVMLKGPFLAMRAAWPALAESRGSVVAIGSTSGVRSESGKAAYCAAKSGLLGLVRTAALEGGADGIRVNAIAPGWMRTDMAIGQLRALADRHRLDEDEALQLLLAHQPVKRFVELDEVCAAALFLAGQGASGITGVTLPVDLGLLAG